MQPFIEEHMASIVGPPRTGTSWLFSLLADHPEIDPLTRADVLPNDAGDESGLFLFLTEEGVKRVLSSVRQQGRTRMLLEKTPWHVQMVQRIWAINPVHRFILCVRHPHDIIGSMLQHWPEWDNDYAAFRCKHMLLCGVRIMTDPRVCVVRYEDMLSDAVGTLDRVQTFLGIHPCSRMLLEHTPVREPRTYSLTPREKVCISVYMDFMELSDDAYTFKGVSC